MHRRDGCYARASGQTGSVTAAAPPLIFIGDAQLPRDLREAISSNARSRAVFQCGPDDAAALAREFAPLDAAALISLGRFEMAARLSIGGQTSRTFSLRRLPPAAVTDGSVASAAIAASRRHARPRDAVDATLARGLRRPNLPDGRPSWDA